MSKLPDSTTLHDLDPTGGLNGSPIPSLSAPTGNNSGPRTLPGKAAAKSRRGIWLTIALIFGLIAGDVGAYYLSGKSLVTESVLGPRTGERPDVILHTVKKEPLTVTVTEKGLLE